MDDVPNHRLLEHSEVEFTELEQKIKFVEELIKEIDE